MSDVQAVELRGMIALMRRVQLVVGLSIVSAGLAYLIFRLATLVG